MSALELTESCAPDEWICRQTYDLTGSTSWANLADVFLGKTLVVLGLLLVGLILRWILHRLVDRLIRRAEHGVLPDRVSRLSLAGTRAGEVLAPDSVGSTRRVQRAKAMGSLLKSVITGIVFAVVGTMLLSELGVDIAPLIASAGIVGVALGFGAQSLVKDFLSGVFMIFEDQYGVGDVVDLGEAIGTVEAVSLRVTRVRDVNGTVWYVRNGEIIRVGNQSQNWARTVLDIAVSYDEDLPRVRRVLGEVAHDLWEDDEFTGIVIEQPEVWGVQDLTPDGVILRVTLKTAPMEQWAVAREMRERIKARFDHERIHFAVGQRMVWQHDDASGANPVEGETSTDLHPEGR